MSSAGAPPSAGERCNKPLAKPAKGGGGVSAHGTERVPCKHRTAAVLPVALHHGALTGHAQQPCLSRRAAGCCGDARLDEPAALIVKGATTTLLPKTHTDGRLGATAAAPLLTCPACQFATHHSVTGNSTVTAISIPFAGLFCMSASNTHLPP